MKTFVFWLSAILVGTGSAYLYRHPEEREQLPERLTNLSDDGITFLQDVGIREVASGCTILVSVLWLYLGVIRKSKVVNQPSAPIVVPDEMPKKKEHGSFVIKLANARILRAQLGQDKLYIECKQRTLEQEIPRTEDEVNKWIKSIAEREKALRIGQEEYAKVLARLTSQKDEYVKNKDQLEDITEELERIKSII